MYKIIQGEKTHCQASLNDLIKENGIKRVSVESTTVIENKLTLIVKIF